MFFSSAMLILELMFSWSKLHQARIGALGQLMMTYDALGLSSVRGGAPSPRSLQFAGSAGLRQTPGAQPSQKAAREQPPGAPRGPPPGTLPVRWFSTLVAKIRISMTRNSSSRRPIWTVGRSRPGTKARTRELNSKTEAKSASMASRGVGKSTPGEGRKPKQPFISTRYRGAS